MNDVPQVIKYSKILMYVDDCQIYLKCPFHELDEEIKLINEDANNLAKWV